MTFESLQVICTLLERETEKLKWDREEASEALKAAVEGGSPDCIVSALESNKAAVNKEYDKAWRALNEFKEKNWR